MIIKFRDKNRNKSIAALLLSAFFIYAIFSVSIGSPIFASDEYAYFISGKYFDHLAELHKLDPGLQNVSNFLYFKLINVWAKFTDSGFTNSFRLLHGVEYVLTAAIIHQTFEKITDRDSAFWGLLAFLLLPNSIYIYAVMPETELVLLAACLGYVLIVIFPRRQYLAAGLAGLLIGASLLIKPHAIAMLSAAIITVTAAPILRLVNGGRVTAIRSVLILLGTCYFALIFLWRLCSHEWSFDPSFALGLKFYGQYLQTTLPSISLVTKALGALHYAVAHLAVITLVFAPVVVWSVSCLVKTSRCRTENPKEVANKLSVAVLFVMAMLVTHTVMVAWFTAGAAALNAGEAMRLHGRYLGPVIAFLPFLYFYAIRNLDAQGERAVKLLTIVALLTCFLYFFKQFQIYPWDYPLLFAFFKASNHYGWNYEGGFSSLGSILLWAMISVWIVTIFFKSIQRRVLFFQIFIILIVGCIQTYNWVFNHTKATSYISESARAISTIIGQNHFGKGLLVSDERYGRASYILYGLANAPKVLIKERNSVVNAADVEGADWVLFGNEYTAEFNYLDSVAFGSFRFFPLSSGVSLERREKSIFKPGERINLSLGAGRHAAANLKGFNTQEEWGAWTRASTAEIVLPVMVQGVVKLKFFGWTLPENLGEPMLVRIGAISSKVLLTGAGKEHEVTIKVSQPTDRIFLESPVFRPTNSGRNMGVAISVISIERQQQ